MEQVAELFVVDLNVLHSKTVLDALLVVLHVLENGLDHLRRSTQSKRWVVRIQNEATNHGLLLPKTKMCQTYSRDDALDVFVFVALRVEPRA